MRNEEWFTFFTEFKLFVEEVSPAALNIEALFVTFLNFYALSDATLEKIRRSSITSVIEQLDARRDALCRGLTQAILSGLNHYDDAHRAAASRLSILSEHYGNLADRPYSEQTGAIINFVQELRGNGKSDVSTLGLEGWVDALDAANSEFEGAIMERTGENAAKSDVNMLDLRRQTGRCYLDIVERIDAQFTLGMGNSTTESFVKKLNANIERYLIAQSRRGGKDKDGEKN
jgi:hypothetical protein